MISAIKLTIDMARWQYMLITGSLIGTINANKAVILIRYAGK